MIVSSDDPLIREISQQVEQAQAAGGVGPAVTSFFDEATNTVTHLVRDPSSLACAVIDSVLDFDQASGKTHTTSAQQVLDVIRAEGRELTWILETHVHADHLSAAPWLQAQAGGRIGIGTEIRVVQDCFGKVLNEGAEFARDGSQFDRLFVDGDGFKIGAVPVRVLHVPGHTPACVAYVVGDAVFVGDTLFMPDYGTARCDFPGGDARTLYRSIRRLFQLPSTTRVFLCHDYKAPGRDHFAWETTIAEERDGNVHVGQDRPEDSFVAMRQQRDAGLGMPRLLWPSIQINMRAGRFPPSEDNGVSYLKLPLGKS